jgi:AcrR family transcriptional regulator
MRRKPEDRKQSILNAAFGLALTLGYKSVTKRGVAAEAGCSPSLVMHYYSTLNKLQRAIIGEAIRRQDLTIIAQGLVHRDSRVMLLPADVRAAACAKLQNQT